jgi:hypothetical protein
MTDRHKSSLNSDNFLSAVAILTTAVLILAVFLLYQAIGERGSLLTTLETQEQPLRQSQKVKEQLEALVTATAKLAEQGNQDAKTIIDGMKSQGISIRQ